LDAAKLAWLKLLKNKDQVEITQKDIETIIASALTTHLSAYDLRTLAILSAQPGIRNLRL
jgi:hypothetical protein